LIILDVIRNYPFTDNGMMINLIFKHLLLNNNQRLDN